MAGLFTAQAVFERYGKEFARIERETGIDLEPIHVPREEGGRLDPADLERIEIAYFGRDVREDREGLTRRFFGSITRSPGLRWLHIGHAGIDDPVFGRLLEGGARISNSSSAQAEAIGQTAITGLLMLSRGFPLWLEAQRRREWAQHTVEQTPADLRGQTLVVLGLGAIGGHIARLGQALGLHVIGVRRSPAGADDPVDETATPQELAQVLPRADWLAIAAPLTQHTRGLIDRDAIAALPDGARIVNIARGPIVDEAAMIEALRSGRLAGAYLDVFEEEPLPADSPLWDLPNVIVTPHDAGSSLGTAGRADQLFLRNLEHWARGEPLENEVAER